MPIYEYRCIECQQLFEEWCKHAEGSSTNHNCPICKGRACRIISNTTFALKGGGWYVTEYGSRRNGEKGGGSASCSESASSEVPAACASSEPCAATGTCNVAVCASA